MVANDLVIFINNDGSTRSFVRMDRGYWKSEQFEGYPTDADIQGIIDSGRLFLLIRAGVVVKTNLVISNN